MNYQNLARVLELRHYRRVLLFILHHPIRFIKRLSMFMKVSIVWTIISTLFGFVLFALVTQSLLAEKAKNTRISANLESMHQSLVKLQNQDQRLINIKLQKDMDHIHDTYTSAVSTYEDLADLPVTSKKATSFRKSFALILSFLSKKNYASASSELKSLSEDLDAEKKALAAAAIASIDTSTATVSNTPPGSGFSRQVVDVNGNKYVVDIVAGNLGSTRVIVDTATDGDCHDNCPVLTLADYVSRNGAYAGINGSYFCPADYPSCAGKSNSFDTLAMNKNKHYINSDNNVYSTVPAVISGSGFLRFVGQSLDWGRDTGVDGVLANQPLLVSGGKSVFGGDGDPKKSGGGTRGFIANKGGTAYIGFVHGASVASAALVLEKMGMDNALNLDSGGSVALWVNGRYQVGPGRSIPNAILFVNK